MAILQCGLRPIEAVRVWLLMSLSSLMSQQHVYDVMGEHARPCESMIKQGSH